MKGSLESTRRGSGGGAGGGVDEGGRWSVSLSGGGGGQGEGEGGWDLSDGGSGLSCTLSSNLLGLVLSGW